MGKSRKPNFKSTSKSFSPKMIKESKLENKTQYSINSEQVNQWLNLAIKHLQSGEINEAEGLLKQVIKWQPSNPEALHLLGVIAAQKKQYLTAIELIKHAIKLNPNEAIFYGNLGNVYQEQKQLSQAIDCYQKAIELQPYNYLEACKNLAIAYKKQGKLPEAMLHYGIAYRKQAKSQQAIEYYLKAIEFNPKYALAHYNLGLTYGEQGQLEEAAECFHKVVQLESDGFYEAKFGLCMSQLPIIYRSFDEIKLRRHNYQQYLQDLANHYQKSQYQEQCLAANTVGSLQPFFLPYQGLNDYYLQKIYGAMICQLMSSRYPQWSKVIKIKDLATDEKIRVGFVSGFFLNGHSIWKIPMKGWVENLDKNKFELFGYYTRSTTGLVANEEFQAFVKFIQKPLPVEKWAEVIAGDKLHVLIFPEIGMDPMTVKLACLRLAPIQMTSLGHPETSGMPTIDYYLSSDLMEPENAQDYYSEKLVRLPNLSIHYHPLKVKAKAISKQELGLTNHEIMFWCCQSLFKYLPQHDDVFPRIAKELANGKFVFIKYPQGEKVNEIFKQRLSQAFTEFGLNYQDYCIFLPRLDSRTFAGTAATADIFLNSISWSGFNSTLEAIAHNIPVVNLSGDLMRGRHTLAILKMMGIEDTIATSKDDYIKIAVRLGRDSQYRQYISQQVAENKHKLYGDHKPIRALEDFLSKLVHQESLSSRSFFLSNKRDN